MRAKNEISIFTSVRASLNRAWDARTQINHILKWNHASNDWHSPAGEQDFVQGGRFRYRMEAKDGSTGFDFSGTFEEITPYRSFRYRLDDGRRSTVQFDPSENGTSVTEVFEAADDHSTEMQRAGWQAILDSFKSYTEGLGKLALDSFRIDSKASPEKVYRSMLEDASYREWTAEFSPGSHAVGTWEKGSKIYFLGPEKEGTLSGMVSRIVENVPNRFVFIEHLGIVNGGEELTEGEEVESWKGAMENYFLIPFQGGTSIIVTLETPTDQREYFGDTWPRALSKLKEIAERP